jgi:hypothetical protein
MSESVHAVAEARFTTELRDPDLCALYEYWNARRGDRPMPRRADIDPMAIPKLLPHIMMYNVLPDGEGYTIRLVGEAVVGFVGRNATGQPAGAALPPRAAALLHEILDEVTTQRLPRFRAGTAHWQPDKSYRAFEACFLPLSARGEGVDIVLCGIKFSASSTATRQIRTAATAGDDTR